MRAFLPLVLVGVFVCLGSSQCAGRGKDDYQRSIQIARKQIWTKLSAGEATAATVAIMDKGKLVYSEGFGMRDRADARPVDKNTQFNIGSISKIFTALAVLTLVDQGKVELDKPVTNYLDDFVMRDERYKEITVRMLLNHTSGFPGSNYKDSFAIVKNPDYLAQTLTYLADSRLKGTPGEVSVYCNDGFTVAEIIVERVSGMTFADYLAKYIFKPCGMKQSSCSFKEGNKNIVIPYNAQTGNQLPKEMVSITGSGGLTSTAVDLCKFSRMLYKKRILSEQSLHEYKKAQYGSKTALGELPVFNCGLGWDFAATRQFAEQGVTVLAKNGGTQEFSSQILVDPDHELTVALIFCGETDVMSVAINVMQALLEGKGVVEHNEVLALQADDAAIPESVLAFSGFYGLPGAIQQISFDTGSNVMQLYQWTGRRFELASSVPYKSDGYFHDGSNRYVFKSFEGNDYLLSVNGKTLLAYFVVAEKVMPIDDCKWSGTAFADITWFFSNLSYSEFGGGNLLSGLIPELKGYVFTGNSDGMFLYQLSSETAADMCLKYARDFLAPAITVEGDVKKLATGNYDYTTINGVAALADGDVVVVGTANEWRQFSAETVFTCDIPEKGRVMILSPGLSVYYDSLMGDQLPIIVPAGYSIAFIGEAGVTFNVSLGSSQPVQANAMAKELMRFKTLLK